MAYLAVAIGGAIGAVARYWISGFVQSQNSSVMPLGTLTVNVFGSLLIGILFVVITEKSLLSETYRQVLIVGLLGAMTTFSTFSLDALLLFQEGHYNTALFYILGSVISCLLAAYAGLVLARIIF